jgi:hypothetical protein
VIRICLFHLKVVTQKVVAHLKTKYLLQMKLKEFSFEERCHIVSLARTCVKKLSSQPLIDYFNKIYRTKFENNGNVIADTIINKYYPDCNERMRDNFHEMMLQFVFDFEDTMEEGEKNETNHGLLDHSFSQKLVIPLDARYDGKNSKFVSKKECESSNSPDGKHLPIAYSCDPSEGYCCKYCCIEISSKFNE